MRSALELTLLGIVSGGLGCWIVLWGLSYGAESLAHAMLPGLIGAALLGLPLLLGGAAGLLVAALAIAAVGRVPRLGSEVAVSVVITTLFGLGVLLGLAPRTPAGLERPAVRRRARRQRPRPPASRPASPSRCSPRLRSCIRACC